MPILHMLLLLCYSLIAHCERPWVMLISHDNALSCLELATVNDKHHIFNGQAGLCNICGDDNFANPFWGALEGLPLLSRGHRRMKRDDPMLPLPILGCAGEPILQCRDLTHTCIPI